MELTDLVTFSAVARTGGITRAAEELSTVQSNVTQRVKALEAEIGTALFERHSRGMTLTGAGRRLLPYAQRMAALSREAMLAARDDGVPKGPLAIGFQQPLDIARRQDAGGERTLAGEFEPVLAVGARQPQHPETGPHTLLGMLARAEQPVDIGADGNPEGSSLDAQPVGRAPGHRLVRRRHVMENAKHAGQPDEAVSDQRAVILPGNIHVQRSSGSPTSSAFILSSEGGACEGARPTLGGV